MNIAVCVSGKCFSQTTEGGTNQVCSLSSLNQRQKEKFPDADFYYATWESDKEIFEETKLGKFKTGLKIGKNYGQLKEFSW